MKTLVAFITFLLVIGALGTGWFFFAAGKREEKIAQMIQAAEKSLNDGDYQGALTLSNAVIEKYREREKLPQILAMRARAYEGLGK